MEFTLQPTDPLSIPQKTRISIYFLLNLILRSTQKLNREKFNPDFRKIKILPILMITRIQIYQPKMRKESCICKLFLMDFIFPVRKN